MPTNRTQTRQNHVRFDPSFHYFLAPASILLLVWAIVHAVRHPETNSVLLAVLAALMVVVTTKARLYALKVQDRVIRLEERLRLSMLLPESLRPRIAELSERQLIALRFASDAELEPLVNRALRENLDGKQIKAAIQTWRPDYWRV